MRPGVWLPASAVLALWASPASAQPLFRFERDWSLEIRSQRYGFEDVIQGDSVFWWTRVWIAGRVFEPAHRPADRWLLVMPPVAAVLVVRYATRPFSRGVKP